MTDKKKFEDLPKVEDKETIHQTLQGLVSQVEHVDGAFAIADDGVVLDELNVEDTERIGAIAVFMGTIGVYVGESLHLGLMENGLVEFQGKKLMIIVRDIYYIGLLIDPKGSVKYIKSMVLDYLKNQA